MVQREAQAGTVNLLVGQGTRACEVAAVLAALASLGSDGIAGGAPSRPVVLGDLEELLKERSGEGLLILESSRVPPEDIGFVRRFLERHAGWTLILLQGDGQDARARDLAGLVRTRPLRWPPDLEALRALLPGSDRRAPSTGARERSGANGSGNPRKGASPPSAASVDLGAVLEEVLAAVALRGDGAPRFQLRNDAPVTTSRAREPLVEAFSDLLDLARCCAGSEGLVRAAVVDGGRGPVVGIEFPQGSLADDVEAVLAAPWPEDEDVQLGAGVAAAARGLARLRAEGAEVEFGASEGRVRCEVRLEPRAAPSSPKAASGRAAKPDDPFA
jgi:hypothetical protein